MCIWNADFSVENDDDANSMQCISVNLAKKLADICVRVEGVFGSPQDIEWVAVEVLVFRLLIDCSLIVKQISSSYKGLMF